MPVRGMSEQQTERINPLLQETDREKESIVFLFFFFLFFLSSLFLVLTGR